VEEGKVQRKDFSYQRQFFTTEGSSSSSKKEPFFSVQSDMNALGEKKNNIKSTDMTMADVL